MENLPEQETAGDLVDRFLETWGALGSLWGISRSVALVHGLLLVTERAWTLDEISDRLRISKSNASTSLKELRSWGVVRKASVPGQRRERWASEPDPWQMLFAIARERKRREFDPILASVRATVVEAARAPAGVALDRIRQLERMLVSLDRVAAGALGSESAARAVLALLEKK